MEQICLVMTVVDARSVADVLAASAVAVRVAHPYDVPEIIVATGNPDYHAWVHDQTRN